MRTARLASTCLLLAACSGPPALLCGQGQDPVIVTGLAGRLDGEPVVEVQLVVPDTCEVLGEAWMFWDEDSDTVTLGEEPTSGTLEGAGVDTDATLIFFRDLNLGVRLDYPGGEVGSELTLTWFSGEEDLATVSCAGADGVLACEVAP